MNKIEKELLKATKIDPRDDDESEADYLDRLVAAVNVLDDDGWNSLSEAAQMWQNTAAELRKEGNAIPSFDESKAAKGKAAAPVKAKGKAKPVAAEEDDDEPEEKPAGKRAAAANGEDDAPAKPKRTRQVSKTGLSAVGFARQHLATHPGCNVEEMAAAIKKAGYATPLSNMTLNSLRNDFRAWSRIFKEQNFLKRDVNLGV